MDIVTAITVYLIFWWVALFIVLPIPIGRRHDNRPAGLATTLFPVLIKGLATTLLAGLLFGAVYAVAIKHVITLNDIPFLPRYQSFGQSAH